MISTLKSSIGKKSIMAATGLLLGLFLIAHLAGNSTAFFGRAAFNSYAEHLHSLGDLIKVFELLLLTVFVVHVYFGIALFLENLEARPCRYEVDNNAGGRTWASRTMPYTGLLTLVFIVHHLAKFHFGEFETVSDLVRDNLSRPISGGYYIFSLAILTLHISHGSWSFFQTLGLNHPKYNTLIRGLTLLISILIGITFIMIPLLALYWPDFLK
ncbi:MAG: succinate dehydrogenase cytochrome b subunit [Thermodesulfobacteriota bacterium]